MNTKILVIGACGQIGSELTLALRQHYGDDQVLATDIHAPLRSELKDSGPFELLDTLDKNALLSCLQRHKITEVYQLAAMLSAMAEKYPQRAWDLNMLSLSHVLDAARDGLIKRIFWPSSIAAFGPNTPRVRTPQISVMNPTSVYGITKMTGELWCSYFHNHYGVDVRSLRYPGIISWKTEPGGGTTDYAVDIYYKALQEGSYQCFLKPDTRLPMMYMPDAVDATLKLMAAPAENIHVRSSYNLAGISFSPFEIAHSIKKILPNFEISYAPDYRQAIADSWPESIDDSEAQKDWGWRHTYELDGITKDMIHHLSRVLH